MLREVILNTENKLRRLNSGVVIPLCFVKQVYHAHMYCMHVYMYTVHIPKVLFPVIPLLGIIFYLRTLYKSDMKDSPLPNGSF